MHRRCCTERSKCCGSYCRVRRTQANLFLAWNAMILRGNWLHQIENIVDEWLHCSTSMDIHQLILRSFWKAVYLTNNRKTEPDLAVDPPCHSMVGGSTERGSRNSSHGNDRIDCRSDSWLFHNRVHIVLYNCSSDAIVHQGLCNSLLSLKTLKHSNLTYYYHDYRSTPFIYYFF